tara:strand:+ start:146 stop:466 length:321 start_codon:yes stop_codon:yes gene_type:complete
MKIHLIRHSNNVARKWGYKYKDYYIVPEEKGRTGKKYYAFYTPDFQSIHLSFDRYYYTTLEYAKSFINDRIEEAIYTFEKQERNEYLDTFKVFVNLGEENNVTENR